MDTSPSTLLADSLATFSKAAHHAFSAVDAEARATVAELEKFKAALAKAEMTIGHLEETILQLRRERSQWKDQSRNWQEHFLRVEQERCKLSSRVDELTAERLHIIDQMSSVVFTPRQKFGDVDSSLSSTTTKQGSPPSNRPFKATNAVDTTKSSSSSTQKSTRQLSRMTPPLRSPSPSNPMHSSHSDPTKASQISAGHSRNARSLVNIIPSRDQRQRMSLPDIRPETSQVLIRRVQAVVQVPVKQEDVDDDPFDPGENSASESGSGSEHITRTNTPPRSQYRRNSRASAIIQSDDDEESNLEDEIVEDEETHPANGGSATVRRRQDGEDEDDELRMGAEDNHKELYGTEPVALFRNGNVPKAIYPPSKKRRLASNGRSRSTNKPKR